MTEMIPLQVIYQDIVSYEQMVEIFRWFNDWNDLVAGDIPGHRVLWADGGDIQVV